MSKLNRLKAAISIFALSLFSANANGDSLEWNDERGFKRTVYAGFGLGVSRLVPDASEVPDLEVDRKVDQGGQLTLGFDVIRHFSVELHAADLGSAGLTSNMKAHYQMNAASVLLYLGKNRGRYKRQGLTGYGRIGAGKIDLGVEGDYEYDFINNAHVLFGAGVEYMTSSGLGLRGELISFDKDAQYVQLGAIYRFGRNRRKPAAIVVDAIQEKSDITMPVVAVEVLDSDNDGVPNSIDICPTTKIGVAVDDKGCALFSGVIEGVLFESDSAVLTQYSLKILSGVADTLREYPEIAIEVVAHTDSQGAADYNQGLSERRAASVVNYLVNNYIDGRRIAQSAYGESRPIDTNNTKEGRLRNRRVEIFSTNPR